MAIDFSIAPNAVSKKYPIRPAGLIETVAAPTVSCVNNVVTMSCSTDGATIKYTIGSGTTEYTYSEPITIAETTIYHVKATKSGYADSSVVDYTATYTLICSAPVVECTNNVVNMYCATPDATIQYKVNDEEQIQGYSSTIPISETTVFHAWAIKQGYVTSTVTDYTAVYVPPVVENDNTEENNG